MSHYDDGLDKQYAALRGLSNVFASMERLHILQLLYSKIGCSWQAASDIYEDIKCKSTRGQVDYALKILRSLDMIEVKNMGNRNYYALSEKGVKHLRALQKAAEVLA